MVSGEYCTFSAFSTMVSRLALDHLDHYLNIIMQLVCAHSVVLLVVVVSTALQLTQDRSSQFSEIYML